MTCISPKDSSIIATIVLSFPPYQDRASAIAVSLEIIHILHIYTLLRSRRARSEISAHMYREPPGETGKITPNALDEQQRFSRNIYNLCAYTYNRLLFFFLTRVEFSTC